MTDQPDTEARIKRAHQDGREAERKAVVAYLRSVAGEYPRSLMSVANDIEEGEHLS